MSQRFECWYDEVDEGDEVVVNADTPQHAAFLFVRDNHHGDERSNVVVREPNGDVSSWDVTSKMEWTHRAVRAKR